MYARKFRNCILKSVAAGLASSVLFGAVIQAQQRPEETSPPPSTTGADSTTSSATEESQSPSMEGLHSNRLPADTFGDQPVGVPYRSVFRNTGGPFTGGPVTGDISSPFRTSPLDTPLKAGNIEGNVDVTIPRLDLGFGGLRRAPEPADAMLKIGSAYFDITSISAGILWTDNTLPENDDGFAAITRMGLAGTFNITDSLQVGLWGELAWFPLTGDVTFNAATGSGLLTRLGILFFPLLQGQVAYDTDIAGWPVRFFDDFGLHSGGWLRDTRNDFYLFDGPSDSAFDRAGRYVFRSRQSAERDTGDTNFDSTEQDPDSGILYFYNRVGAMTQKDLPTQTRFRASAVHENIVFIDTDNSDSLTTRRDSLNLYAASIRENMRFKPYAEYRAVNTDTVDGVSNSLLIGVRGPITDQLDFRAAMGTYWNTARDGTHFIWNLALWHDAGPYTKEAIVATRSYDDLTDYLVTSVTYWITQVIGKNMNGRFFVGESWYEDLGDRDVEDFNVFRTGVQLQYLVSPKTTIVGTAIYSDYHGGSDIETFTGRLEIDHSFTDTLTARLLYQYQSRDSSLADEGFTENLVLLDVTKYFR